MYIMILKIRKTNLFLDPEAVDSPTFFSGFASALAIESILRHHVFHGVPPFLGGSSSLISPPFNSSTKKSTPRKLQ